MASHGRAPLACCSPFRKAIQKSKTNRGEMREPVQTHSRSPCHHSTKWSTMDRQEQLKKRSPPSPRVVYELKHVGSSRGCDCDVTIIISCSAARSGASLYALALSALRTETFRPAITFEKESDEGKPTNSCRLDHCRNIPDCDCLALCETNDHGV